jgi:regulator of protease activity HflC (stomatin/prohibitin superfamily)
MDKFRGSLVFVVVIAMVVIAVGGRFFKVVPTGHVGVAALFGKVVDKPYAQGLHLPVNPLYHWTLFDTRQKTHKEVAGVPSQDQLTTRLEVSVQFRIEGDQAAEILKNTGSADTVIRVHLEPKLRSLLREQGKSIKRAEDFFLEETQQILQESLKLGLSEFMAQRGVEVQDVLIRDIELPGFIIKAIEEKKVREQEAQKQIAELGRYRTEQAQKVALAEAERDAAAAEAEKVKVLADAQAYKIEKINTAIGNNPTYIKLMALETLTHMSKDPAAKIYFLNGDSPQPLPLMHVGENILK